MKDTLKKIFIENSSCANNGQMSVITEDSYDDCASEITDTVKDFNEWKDERINSGKIIWHEGFYFYAKKYTHDELFDYWYNEIRDKK